MAAALLLLGPVALGGCRQDPPPSILLLVVDTLRADRLGLYGYRRDTSPELDRRAAEGAVFERAFASSSWTLPTFASILTGRLPSGHRAGQGLADRSIKGRRGLATELPTVAELLAGQGWATAAVVNNPWLKTDFGLDRGFGLYDNETSAAGRRRRADQVVDRALAWLDGHDGSPFFLLVHLFDPHLPYDAPEPFRGRFTSAYDGFSLPVARPRVIRRRLGELSATERGFIAAAYDEEVAFVDRELGRLLTALETKGLAESLVILLTSDHGEELFDHAGFEHGHSMHQEVLHVPLIAWGPGVRAGRIDTPVSVTDLAPTILQTAGLETPAAVAGRSLWGLLGGERGAGERSLVAEGTLWGGERKALVRWPWKLIAGAAGGGRELYDLAGDPEELHDLAPQRPELADRLAGELAERIERAGREFPGGDQAPATETLEELRALGYID